MDYLGPLPLNNKYVLVIIDQRSPYPEIQFVSSTSAKSLIKLLSKVFAIYGNPSKVISDNGPPFKSKFLKEYMESKGIRHHRITPVWPQANVLVERFNRPLMKVIKAAYAEGKDMQEASQTFLAAYRSTPHSSTRVAPSTIMFGREIKHTLPQVPTMVKGGFIVVEIFPWKKTKTIVIG